MTRGRLQYEFLARLGGPRRAPIELARRFPHRLNAGLAGFNDLEDSERFQTLEGAPQLAGYAFGLLEALRAAFGPARPVLSLQGP
jgi:hypothetical protein